MSEPGAQQWSFSRVLSTMDEQGRTGILECTSGEGTTRIHLRQGYVVSVEDLSGDNRWVLGEFLVRSGTVTDDALLTARKEAQKKNLEIEEVLVQRGHVSEDVLKRFVDLQTADLLFPLFRRKGLAIKLVEERPTQNRYGTPLPVSFVLRESERQAQEWPTLRQRVGRPEAIYRKDGSVMGEILGYEDAPEDDSSEPLPDLSANARVVYFFINGKKTVEQVARAAGLTIFDTYAAMAELLDAVLLTLVTTHGEGELETEDGSHVPRVVTILTYFLVAAVLALGGQWAISSFGEIRAAASASSPKIDRLVSEAGYHQIDRAILLYELEFGGLPAELGDLLGTGYVSGGAARHFEDLVYSPSGDAWTLARSAPP